METIYFLVFITMFLAVYLMFLLYVYSISTEDYRARLVRIKQLRSIIRNGRK